MRRRILLILIILLNIGCDQVSKEIVRQSVVANSYQEITGKHFVLTKVENFGAFLGFGSSLTPILKNILLLGLPTILLLTLIVYLFRSKKMELPLILAFGCIIGGGIGNLYDRFIYGSVTDFLHLDFGFFKTGIFNMADVSVTTGIIFLFFYNVVSNIIQKN